MTGNKVLEEMFRLSDERLLEVIRDGIKWIESQRSEESGEIRYIRSDDDDLSADRNYPNPNSFHAGLAGLIPFYLTCYRVFEEPGYIDRAREIGDQLLRTNDLEKDYDPQKNIDDPAFNIYGEIPGEASAMLMLYSETGDGRYLEFVKAAFEMVAHAAVKTDNGCKWSGNACYSMAGDAGTLLFMVDMARRLNDHRFDDVIRGVANELVSYHGEDQTGVFWKALNPTDDPDYDVYWPGLEFGTSGVAQALAESGEYLNDSRLLGFAEEGAKHLIRISMETDNEGVLFPMNTRNPDTHYLGHCYGNMGISKLFFTLYRKTKNEAYKRFLKRITNGIESTGAPSFSSTGYWNNSCYCCGTAGLLSMYLGLYAAFGELDDITMADMAAHKLVGDSFNDDGKGLRWYQAYTRMRPWDVHTFNGYILGNAGDVTMLMQLYLTRHGRFKAYRFVEDPFPED